MTSLSPLFSFNFERHSFPYSLISLLNKKKLEIWHTVTCNPSWQYFPRWKRHCGYHRRFWASRWDQDGCFSNEKCIRSETGVCNLYHVCRAYTERKLGGRGMQLHLPTFRIAVLLNAWSLTCGSRGASDLVLYICLPHKSYSPPCFRFLLKFIQLYYWKSSIFVVRFVFTELWIYY